MPARMKARLVLLPVALLATLAVAGCGGGGGSGPDPVSLAPPGSSVFVEVRKPEGQAAEEVESLAEKIAGIHNLGNFIVSELESSASGEGGGVDYEREVKPWLGDRAGIFLDGYDGQDFSEVGAAVQVTDAGAAGAFLAKRARESDEPVRHATYEGLEYEIQADGTAIGVVGEFVAYGKTEKAFKAMVRASDGESLADQDSYASAVAEVPGDALVDAYADVGALVEEGGGAIDPQTKTGLTVLGIEPEGATLVASAVPGSDQIEIDLSSDALPEPPPAGDASKLLGSLPAESVAALASPEAGKTFAQAIDRLDREGIPQEGIPPGKLKSIFAEAGIELESIAGSVGDVAAFVEGEAKSSLGGSVVLASDDPTQAENTVASVGLLLRASGTKGVTALSGKLNGFSVHSASLGPKPLIVATIDKRIVVAYGLPAALKALGEPSRALAEDPLYKEAVASLGSTPISGFADGPAALRLASSLISPEQREGFGKAKPYLSKIAFLALGSESTSDLAKARLIVGVGK
jgi:Protein of unknown function (DUF3352)